MELRSLNPAIFKTRWFERFARKEKIADTVLVDAVARAENRQVDAELGGGVIKQRIARPGRASPVGIERSFFFAGAYARFSFTASQRATGRTSTPMKRSSSRRQHAMCCS
jgi:hypothetical protein